MNSRLYELYTRHWECLMKNTASFPDLSAPHLMDLPDSWDRNGQKLVVVGQQANRWCPEFAEAGNDPIKRLMADYMSFECGRFYRPTPFWQASWLINMSLPPPVVPFSFAWTNLVKRDQRGERPRRDLEKSILDHFPVVAEEMKIAAPDVVVFFTGPCYDEVIKEIWPNAELKSFEGFDRRKLAQVEHADLPQRSVRTYHPNYLAHHAKEYSEIMEQLVSFVAQPQT